MTRPRYVYIAAPLTAGNLARNLHIVSGCMIRLIGEGFAVFAPHLMFFADMMRPRYDWEEWMQQCLLWVERCDAVLRLEGDSPGADREVAHAEKLGKPVFLSEAALVETKARKLRPR